MASKSAPQRGRMSDQLMGSQRETVTAELRDERWGWLREKMSVHLMASEWMPLLGRLRGPQLGESLDWKLD